MDEGILHHLYISPVEKCNLGCKICYTFKSGDILTNEKILDYVDRYNKVVKVKTITFCGGEVFALTNFSELVNELTRIGYFIQIITNGTIDRLDQFKNPNLINIIVSLDGLPKYHDKNRGAGNFRKSFTFLQKAQKMGFHTEVFSIITQENLPDIEKFEKLVKVPVTYHPRKPIAYLTAHPVSNIVGETKGFSFITAAQRAKLGSDKKIFPPLNFGCWQVSLMSNGVIYGCCEGITAIGRITDDPKLIIERFKKRMNPTGCIEPCFMCGYKDECHS